jgi:hypothetical protein
MSKTIIALAQQAGFSKTYEPERLTTFARLLLEEIIKKQEHLMHDGISPMQSYPHLKQHLEV